MSRGKYQGQNGAQSPRRDFSEAAANQNVKIPQLLPSYGFTAKNDSQQEEADLIDANDVTFSTGPAGTGKTHIAMVKAVEGFNSGKYQKILLSRPAVEAGETIGFVPGDLNAKMEPYMRPLYDELDKAYGSRKEYKGLIRSVGNRNPNDDNPDGLFEICPPGMMRGRTLENTFIIIDEAQNLRPEELKMILTRLGPGSKMVITGDPGQIDLKPASDSGLMDLIESLKGVEGVASQSYERGDVVRHPTVQNIVDKLERKTQGNQEVDKTPVARRASPLTGTP